MKFFLERISRVQYIVGFFVLALLRGILLPVPEITFFEGDGVATSSLFMGLTLLIFPIVLWLLEQLEIQSFIRRLFALGFGVIGLFLFNSDPGIYFFALGLGLLQSGSGKKKEAMDWRLNGLLMLCGVGLLANVWIREKWLLILLVSLVLLSSIVWERLKKRLLSSRGVPK